MNPEKTRAVLRWIDRIRRGIVPLVLIQLIGPVVVILHPELVTWLPGVIFCCQPGWRVGSRQGRRGTSP